VPSSQRLSHLALLLLALILPGFVAVTVAAAAPPPVLVVEGPESLRGPVAEIEGVSPERLQSVAELVGLDERDVLVPVAVRDERSEEARSKPGWVAGYASSRLVDGEVEGRVVVFPSRGRSWPDRSLEGLVLHELSHILLARASGGRPVPRWFNEGTAMAAAEAFHVEGQTRFALERLRSGAVPLSQVDAWFTRGNDSQVRRAYAVAGEFVYELRRRDGASVVADILDRVAAGDDFERAFRRVTGRSLAQTEAEFWERNGGWRRFLPFLTSAVAVWMLASLLVLPALARRRLKTKRLEEKWEEAGLGEHPDETR
jgi:hypothetical protein